MRKVFLLTILLVAFYHSHSQCNKPTALYVSATTANSATLGFLSGGVANWQIEYGSIGFTLGNGTRVNVSSTTPTINGLAGATTYDFYVRDTCINGTVSAWAGPKSFTTTCSGVAQAPYSINFESNNWKKPTTWNTPGVLATCWLSTPASNAPEWTVGPPFFPSFNTGPSGDHTTGSGKYVHMDQFGFGISKKITELRMPRTSLVGLSSPEISFWYHMYGSDIDKLVVQVRKYNGSWVNVKSFVGQQQTSKTAAWKKSIISLNQFKNDTIFIRFKGVRKNGSQRINIAIDDIIIKNGAVCPKPSNFVLVSKNNNSVTLKWQSGGALNWQIEYGAVGFTLGTGTKLNVSSKPFTITGLTPQTIYSFYVRDSCNATDKSAWEGPINIATDCTPKIAPYTEDFEGNSWVKPGGFGQVGSINSCWVRQHSSVYYWDTGPPSFVNSFTGPSADHTTGSGKYIFTERNNFFSGLKTAITSPLIDLSNLTVPEMSFWYHLYGSNISKLEVLVDSGNGYIVVKTFNGAQQTSNTDAWKEGIVNLSAYANTSVKVRFRGKVTSTFSNQGRMSIDDLSIKEAPSCPKPTNLQLASTTSTKANIKWTTGGAINWIIKYKPVAGSLSYQAISANPYALTGLTASTTYNLWLRDSCGTGDVSDWVGPLVFRTDCNPLSTPYSENFDGGGFAKPTNFANPGTINSCWSRDRTNAFYWETGKPFFTNNFTGPSGDHTTGTGQYLVSDSKGFATGTDTTYIFSPSINVSTLNTPELTFWYHMYGSGIKSLRVDINNGTGWTSIFTKTGGQQTAATSAWKKGIVNLSTYSNDTIKLRFRSIRNPNNAFSEIAIDDLSIHELPTCPDPTNLILQSITSNSAAIKWTTGGASNWIVKYKANGGSLNFNLTTSNNPYYLSGLSPNTQYQLWVRDSCGSNDVSLWIGPLRFRTDCTPIAAPFTEDFDGTGWVSATSFSDNGDINSCWKRSDTSSYSWVPRTGASFIFGSGPSGDHTGNGNYLMTNRVGFTATNTLTELSSPWISIGNMQVPKLKFWYHMYGADIDKLKVYALKLGGSKTLLTTIIGQKQTSKTAAWLEKIISLNAFKNDTIKLIFEGSKKGFTFNVNLAIDDVSIKDAVCVNPSSLTVTNIKSKTADITWVTTNTNSNLEYGLSGFTQGQGTYVANVSSVYSLTGLTPFKTYDVYIKDSCATNNTSAWVGPVTFDTKCDTLIADFSSSATNTSVIFDGTLSAGSFMNFSWDFGDGTTGVSSNPNHNYTTGGTYTVTLIVIDTCGNVDTAIKSITICDKPIAVINYTVNGLKVDFDGTASVGAVSYLWDLANGGFNILPNPSFTYPGNGSYNISLVITNACGDKDTANVVIVLCDKPTAYFEFKIKGSNGSGMTVDFDGTLSQTVSSFMWYFGDGTTDNTTLKPTHVYAVPGLFYKVTLITYSSCGISDTMSVVMGDVISIDEWGDLLISAFPNPATEMLRIEIPESTNELTFKWFDVGGRLLNVPMIDSGNTSFDFNVSALKPGVYLLVLTDDSGSTTLRIVVE